MVRKLFSSAAQREWHIATLAGIICFAAAISVFNFIEPAELAAWMARQPSPIPGVILSAIAGVVSFCVTTLVALIGIVRQNMRITAALNNMTQGLCMFDGATRLIICNDRYLEMYGLTRKHAYPGCSLRELL